MNKDQKRLLLIGLTVVTLALGVLVFYLVGSQIEGELGVKDVWAILIPTILVLSMVMFIVKNYRSLKSGLPLEDERSKKVIDKAASRAFYFTMYWLLFISIMEKPIADLVFHVPESTLDAGRVVGGGIFGMTIAFFVLWMYYNRKSNL